MKVIRNLLLAFRRWKIISIVYCFQLLLALTLGLQVYQVIEASMGQSMSLGRMITKFDYTILQDLFNVHGASLSPLIGKLRWYILLYMIFSGFINAGIWNALIDDDRKKDWTSFWLGGAKYFGKFIGVGIAMTILFAIWSALIWAPYLGSFLSMMETWLNDSHIIWMGLLLFFLWIHGVAFLFVWGAYSRVSIVTESTGVWNAITKNFKFALRRFFRLLLSLWLFALILFLLYFVVVFLESNIGISSVGLITGFFLLQQFVIWLKIVHRIGVYKFLLKDFQNKNQ
ncbi:MAG: hypothetical protein ACI9FN_002272 [Saprospiraceae bacterium]|jgi:hypothetical protein